MHLGFNMSLRFPLRLSPPLAQRDGERTLRSPTRSSLAGTQRRLFPRKRLFCVGLNRRIFDRTGGVANAMGGYERTSRWGPRQRLAFDYQQARSTRAALEAFAEGVGVCRDFTHLAVTRTNSPSKL